MNGNRISIVRVMIFIAFVAIGVAALREPSPVWTSLLYSLAFGCNFLAVVGAIVGAGRIRSAAIGFAVCGWGYFVLAISQTNAPGQTSILITSVLVRQTLDLLTAGLPSHERDLLSSAADALFIIAAGVVGGLFAWYLSRRPSDLAPPTLPNTDQP